MKRSALFLLIAAACSAPADDAELRPDGDLIPDTTVLAGPVDTAERGGSAMCGIDAEAHLSGEGVGAFRVGTPVDDLLSACPQAARDELRDIEGMMQEVVDLRRDTGMVQAQIVDGRVWRVHVTDPTITTKDGLHVRSTVAELIERDAVAMTGEGRLFAVIGSICGMSFGIDAAPDAARAQSGQEALGNLPADAQVGEILAFGCG